MFYNRMLMVDLRLLRKARRLGPSSSWFHTEMAAVI